MFAKSAQNLKMLLCTTFHREFLALAFPCFKYRKSDVNYFLNLCIACLSLIGGTQHIHSISQNALQSVLRIINVQSVDAGNYSCVAGPNRASLFINIKGK